MLRITEKSIVYVVCPSYHKTGGTELAHQLVYELNNKGIESYITYVAPKGGMLRINPAFEKYVSVFKSIDDIEDTLENVIVLPEINQNYISSFKEVQICIWWMSVDNYFKTESLWGAAQYFGIWQGLKLFIKGDVSLTKKELDKKCVHLYQSEYARQFLIAHGMEKCMELSDYLNDEYFVNSMDYKDREDIILYNPNKGMAFTKLLINAAPNLNWIPIINMSTEEVHNLMKKCKVYIDFGNHPGKDRMPREAAICGCCIITGKRGSAKYYKDIPIEEEFKFDDIEGCIDDIIKQIVICLRDYDNQIKRFENYRQQILSEKELFSNDIDKIFRLGDL